jgi:hypothetical protein
LEPAHFITLAESLTGTPVKDLADMDHEILGQLLADDARAIGHSQFNELLLKDRKLTNCFWNFYRREDG